MTLNCEENSRQGKVAMASEQQDKALEAALRQAIRAQYHFRPSEQGLLAWVSQDEVDALAGAGQVVVEGEHRRFSLC